MDGFIPVGRVKHELEELLRWDNGFGVDGHGFHAGRGGRACSPAATA